ncbi:Chorismate synthase, chloroplastic [Capsicum annuum]|nr:Chorismate synthase, chloroplastic [Capsicum annuum]
MASSLLTKQFIGAPFSSFGSVQLPSKFTSSNFQIPAHRSQHKRLEIQAAGSTYGNYFRITTFGESHGGGVGCIIDGCPPRLPLSESDMQVELDRRRPGQSRITTPRKETDTCKISSGTADGLTTGSPIKVEVPNTDQRGNDYSEMSLAYRPSHADATYDFKYGVRSVQGGGRSSARETIGRVAAGAVAKKILKLYSGTEILAYVSQVHNVVLPEDLVDNQTVTLEQIESNIVRCPNPEYAEKMIAAIDYVRVRGDSVGGVVTCIVRNVPRGLGTPVFDKLEAELAKACMSLPATKGFEFGSGFAGIQVLKGNLRVTGKVVGFKPWKQPSAEMQGTFMTGSEHNDEFIMDEHDRIRTRTNRSGGIQGGISNGEIINMRIAFKPTSTIARKQQTVSRDKHETELIARGRHDPCVVPRAVPMVEAMVALVLVDQLMAQYAQCMLFPINPALQEPLQLSTTESAEITL